MHGIILRELEPFIKTNYDEETWDTTVKALFGERRTYNATQNYSDEEMAQIVKAISEMLNVPIANLVEQFGMFLVPRLFKRFYALLDPYWKTLGVLEHADSSIHKMLTVQNPTVAPPSLECSRTGKNEVTIIYYSDRKLCNLLRGMAKGVADYFNENLEIDEKRCVHRGDEVCEFVFEITKSEWK